MIEDRPGAFAMAVTPMDPEGRIDEDAFRAHLRRLARAGIGVVLGSPGSGEGQLLDLDELRRVYDIGVSELAGKVPTIAAGRESRSAAALADVAREAEQAGVDAMQVYPIDMGHGHRPVGLAGGPGSELERYYRDMFEVVTIPIHLSSHQGVGYVQPVGLIARMVDEYPHVRSMMVSNERLEYVARMIDAVGDRVRIYVSVHNVPRALVLGAEGTLDTTSNIAPNLVAEVARRYRAGDLAGALQAGLVVARLGQALGYDRNGNFTYTTPRSIKAALHVLGLLPCGAMRHPFLPVPDEVEAAMGVRLRALLDELGIDDPEAQL